VRSNFRVDTILEPGPATAGPRSPDWRETFKYVPRTLIIRAPRKGSRDGEHTFSRRGFRNCGFEGEIAHF
jgi:hypothetical protein